MKKLFLPLCAFGLWACSTAPQKTQDTNQEASNEIQVFGENIDSSKAQNFLEIQKLALSEGLAEGTIKGTILETCDKKGCWMEVATGTDTLFVKFKDYGFFVPTSGVEGKTVYMQGLASLDTVSVDELRHYAEDAGKSEEEIAAITDESYEVRFVANGVIIRD